MIHYRKIFELHHERISRRGIAASTDNSRQKVTEIIELAEKKGLVCPLEEGRINGLKNFSFRKRLDGRNERW